MFLKNKILLVCFLLWSACASAGHSSQNSVMLQTFQGTFPFDVELADTPEKRTVGLMNRTQLADDQGMLFVWDQDVRNSFWMKNTFVSLDMIFIDRDHRIVFIAEGTEPLSTDLITPTVDYRSVLEIKSGGVRSTGAQVGDTVK